MYWLIGQCFASLFVAIVVVVIFIFLFICAKNWIDDKKPVCNWAPAWTKNKRIFTFDLRDPFDFWSALVVFALCGIIGSMLWPLSIIAGLAYLSLYTLRGFVRFKKKIKKALEGKNSADHIHEWEEK